MGLAEVYDLYLGGMRLVYNGLAKGYNFLHGPGLPISPDMKFEI